jgi:hypothetical protein
MPSADDDAGVVEAKVDEILQTSRDATNLPGNDKAASASAQTPIKKVFPRAIARVLDDLLEIPNCKIRIGLDPIIGFLFPAVGDAITATLGTTILVEGARRQLPKTVLIRMAANIAINAAMGSIPVIGDLFSIWFKSNAQNNALLESHSGDIDQQKVRPNPWILLAFLLGVFGIIALVVFGLIVLGRWLF